MYLFKRLKAVPDDAFSIGIYSGLIAFSFYSVLAEGVEPSYVQRRVVPFGALNQTCVYPSPYLALTVGSGASSSLFVDALAALPIFRSMLFIKPEAVIQ